MSVKTNCQTSYGYPYSMCKQVEIADDSDVVIYGHAKTTSLASTLANHMITFTPIVCL